jgi:hypothetical protein
MSRSDIASLRGRTDTGLDTGPGKQQTGLFRLQEHPPALSEQNNPVWWC